MFAGANVQQEVSPTASGAPATTPPETAPSPPPLSLPSNPLLSFALFFLFLLDDEEEAASRSLRSSIILRVCLSERPARGVSDSKRGSCNDHVLGPYPPWPESCCWQGFSSHLQIDPKGHGRASADKAHQDPPRPLRHSMLAAEEEDEEPPPKFLPLDHPADPVYAVFYGYSETTPSKSHGLHTI